MLDNKKTTIWVGLFFFFFSIVGDYGVQDFKLHELIKNSICLVIVFFLYKIKFINTNYPRMKFFILLFTFYQGFKTPSQFFLFKKIIIILKSFRIKLKIQN